MVDVIAPCAKTIPAPKPALHWIKFKIQDDKGIPLKDIVIRLKLPDGAIEEATSDAGGNIEIKNVKPGNCTLILDWEGYRATEVAYLQ